MVRQRQADLLLVAATQLSPPCGWIFSHMKPSRGYRFSPSLGCVLFCGAAAAAPFVAALPWRRHWRRDDDPAGCGLPLNLCLWIYSVSDHPPRWAGAFIMSLSMLFVPLCPWVMMKTRLPGMLGNLPVAIVGLGLLVCICRLPSTQWARFLLTARWCSRSGLLPAAAPRCALDPADHRAAVAITGARRAGISAAVRNLGPAVYACHFRLAAGQYYNIATSLRFGLQMGQKYAAVASLISWCWSRC